MYYKYNFTYYKQRIHRISGTKNLGLELDNEHQKTELPKPSYTNKMAKKIDVIHYSSDLGQFVIKAITPAGLVLNTLNIRDFKSRSNINFY